MIEHRPGRAAAPSPHASVPAVAGALHVVALILVSLNLRGAISAVSPVLDDIRADLGLSAGQASLLTTLPVLCFAVGSLLVPAVARRWGADRSVCVALLLIAAGIALRPWGGATQLLIGTVVIGAGITVGNVLIPVLVKRDFSHRLGAMTGTSTASLTAGAAVTAALIIPLSHAVGWRAGTAVWAVLALAGAWLWAVSSRGRGDVEVPATGGRSTVWRSGGGWALGLYFGCQSGLYYAVTAWLPGLLRDVGGLSVGAAGTAMSVFQVLGISGALLAPFLLTRSRSPRVVAASLGVVWVVAFVGLLTAPGLWAVWVVVAGVVQGGAIAVVFTLIARRSVDQQTARSLSAMVQAVGYSLAACVPVLVGVLSGAGWHASLLVMTGIAVMMAMAGLIGGGSSPIGDARPAGLPDTADDLPVGRR
ncbi:MFS transporter [Cellulomonas chengniuliangii]|uniref:MFS transporter n=1 Tax=Cellulomonas chengniuliangii TaxID=2968084 RepID=A0ABY5KXN0_9CELL|nr:MFS transporter [Cellulomonas chengniuliangii]MCC2309993.1 MFS transporter [Cellulomonas chengniuliangii]UUI74608.1 MFS transporter [Cellulomonas chengniuliangii]